MPVTSHRSELPVPADVAWAHATSVAGIQRELPWPMRITTVPPVVALEDFLVAVDLLAELRFGPLRVLRWHPGIVELGDRHFVEASDDMTMVRSWRHERTVAPAGDGHCLLTDVVTFDPRMPGTALLVAWLFRRRHRALRRALR